MKPGLKMMMMQPKERMDYDDPNRRRIGFGANENLPRPPRPDDPLDPHRYVPQDPRIFPPEPRRKHDEPHRMMRDYPDDPEMRRRRDERGRYMTGSYERREQEPVRAGGEFWMIPPTHEKKLTREKAEHWVHRMARHGEPWSFEDTTRLADECGVPSDMQSRIDFYAAVNMMKSDYHSVADRYGLDDKMFYAHMAMAFLFDEDGKPPAEKLAAYYKHVVPHEDD